MYEFMVRLAQSAPYNPIGPHEHAINRRGTAHVIQLIRELGITPRHLVDVGANKSQWAVWLVKVWPDLHIDSFEPLHGFTPIGNIWRCALSDEEGQAVMVEKSGGSHITAEADGINRHTVPVHRFDGLGMQILSPAILKVDCENYTAQALRGFGRRINDFSLVVIEMWNDWDLRELPHFKNQQAEIWEFMLANGFRMARVTDYEYAVGSIPVYDIAFYKDG